LGDFSYSVCDFFYDLSFIIYLGTVNEVTNSSLDNAIKSLDIQSLFPRAIGGVETGMLFTMEHLIDGMVVSA
jgi:hypothetical protein